MSASRIVQWLLPCSLSSQILSLQTLSDAPVCIRRLCKVRLGRWTFRANALHSNIVIVKMVSSPTLLCLEILPSTSYQRIRQLPCVVVELWIRALFSVYWNSCRTYTHL